MYTNIQKLFILELISFDILYQLFEEFYKIIIYVFKLPYLIYNSILFKNNYSNF
jgi:hypothetical protein